MEEKKLKKHDVFFFFFFFFPFKTRQTHSALLSLEKCQDLMKWSSERTLKVILGLFFGSERAKKAIRVYLFVLSAGNTERVPAGGVFFLRQQHSQHTTNAPASLLIGDTLPWGIYWLQEQDSMALGREERKCVDRGQTSEETRAMFSCVV